MTTSKTQESVHTMEVRKEEFIAAPIEIVFESLLDEMGSECQLQDGKPFPMKLEPWPGGRWYRDLGDDAGHLWGHVQVIKPPKLLEVYGQMPMSFPAVNHLQYRLTEEKGGTRLALYHQAMGLIPVELREGMGSGWEYVVKRVGELAMRRKGAATKSSQGASR